jgi:hypothetical protein
MAIRKVTLKIRIKMPDGKRPYCAPVWEVKGRLRPLFARINGKSEHHPEGVYALRYGDKWEFVGKETDRVMARKLALEQELEDAANNPVSPKVLSIKQAGFTIAEACATHLERISKPDSRTGKEALAPKTIDGFRHTFEAFQRSCKKVYLKEVDGDDIVNYLATLREQVYIHKDRPDFSEIIRRREVTVKNHFASLRRLFKKNGVDIAAIMEDEQIPRPKGRTPEGYSEEEINKLWAAADDEQRDRLKFYAGSGFRKQEDDLCP